MADIVFTDQNFQTQVLKSDKPVLVDFWAVWCGPCKMVSPIVDELAGEYKDKMLVGKLNVDENQEISGKYQIMSIPTLAFFKNGEIVKTLIGALPKDQIKKAIDEVLS